MYDPAKHTIISNASCTTNCLAPAAKVVHDKWGIVARPHDDDPLIHRRPDAALTRRTRTRGARVLQPSTSFPPARAPPVRWHLVIPDLKGKFDGMSMRVPTPTVSIVDFVAELKNNVTLPETHCGL